MSLQQGFLGGALIGSAAGVLLLAAGEIMGASGIVSSIFLAPRATLQDSSRHWKLAFLGSFLTVSSLLAPKLDPDLSIINLYGGDSSLNSNPWAYGLAGLLVGAGTKLGNGCTSGHGICGLARFSKRSLVAVCTFMATGIATVSALKPLDMFANKDAAAVSVSPGNFIDGVVSLAGPTLFGISLAMHFLTNSSSQSIGKLIVGAVSGGIFASGLFVSGMAYQSRVLGFLDVSGILDGIWDPTLAMVMMGGLLVSFTAYQWVPGFSKLLDDSKSCFSKPVCASKFGVPNSTVIDGPLIMGAILFGLGWGTVGLCPGPALFVAGANDGMVIGCWWPAYLVGAFAVNEYNNKSQATGSKTKKT